MQPANLQRGVIVADDSIIIRDNVRAALGEPWRIFLAVDGVEALEYARGMNAELVLLDFQMPRMDGVDTCALIRRLPNYAAVPIVLLTAYDSVDLRRRAAQAGATAVFSKPFSATALRAGGAATDRARARRRAGARTGTPRRRPRHQTRMTTSRPVATFSSVYRKVEAAADPQRYGSFAELMAARRLKSRR